MSSYQLLEHSSNDSLDGEKDHMHNTFPSCGHRRPEPTLSRTSLWTILAVLLLTCINALLLYASSSLPNQCIDPIMQVTTENLHELRRPSPFIGLQDIQRPVPPVQRELVNFPQVLQQVDGMKGRKDFVYDDDPLAYMSINGFVSPESRRVLVTNAVSTLAQFRVIDFGMESCELHVEFPMNSTIPPGSNPFIVSVNRLEGRVPLNTRTLSYNTRPKQTSSLVQLRVNPLENYDGMHWWQKFPCKWDQLLIFELECYDEGRLGDDEGNCRMEWWQDKKEDVLNPAIYLKQYATV